MHTDISLGYVRHIRILNCFSYGRDFAPNTLSASDRRASHKCGQEIPVGKNSRDEKTQNFSEIERDAGPVRE
jgi:hypothetical protein